MKYLNYCEEQLIAAEKEAWKKRIKLVNDYLNPCLCCGGKAEVREDTKMDGKIIYHTIYIECDRCGLRTKELITDGYYDERHTPEEAAELWNRRYSGIDDKNGNPICNRDHIRIAGKNVPDNILGEYKVWYSPLSFKWWLKKVVSGTNHTYARNISFSDLCIGRFKDMIEIIDKGN